MIPPVNIPAAVIETAPEVVQEIIAAPPKIDIPVGNDTKVSALSLSSIRAKRELEQTNRAIVHETNQLPNEEFTETVMLEFWYKYAQRLVDNKKILMATNMQISEPKLNGSRLVLELPNESVKEEFNAGKTELLGYLRGHLHNHDIDIEIIVNEEIATKKAFTTQDKYNRLNEINPNLDLLRKTFDLDI